MFSKLKKGLDDWLRGYEKIVAFFPNHTLIEIFKFMKLDEILEATRTSKQWRVVIDQGYFWVILLMSHYPEGYKLYLDSIEDEMYERYEHELDSISPSVVEEYKKHIRKYLRKAKPLYMIFHDNIFNTVFPSGKLQMKDWFMIEYVKEETVYEKLLTRVEDFNPEAYRSNKLNACLNYISTYPVYIFFPNKEVWSHIPNKYLAYIVYLSLFYRDIDSNTFFNDEKMAERMLDVYPLGLDLFNKRFLEDPKFFFDERFQKVLYYGGYKKEIAKYGKTPLSLYSEYKAFFEKILTHIRRNIGFMKKMIKKDITFIKHAKGTDLMNDRDFFRSLDKYWYIDKTFGSFGKQPVLKHAGELVIDSKPLVLKALKSYWGNYKYISLRLKQDKEINSGWWYKKFIGAEGGPPRVRHFNYYE